MNLAERLQLSTAALHLPGLHHSDQDLFWRQSKGRQESTGEKFCTLKKDHLHYFYYTRNRKELHAPSALCRAQTLPPGTDLLNSNVYQKHHGPLEASPPLLCSLTPEKRQGEVVGSGSVILPK